MSLIDRFKPKRIPLDKAEVELNQGERLKAKYGADYFKKIGAKGGLARNPRKGYGSHPELIPRKKEII